MSRGPKPSTSPVARTSATVAVVSSAEATMATVSGLVDERFTGFGALGTTRTVIINVAEMTRMTSFGVRQWLKAMDALPKSVTDLYLFGCPTFFVDQLNMVLNFGGPSKVLTVVAPYTCTSCGVESGEMVDVLADRSNLAKGVLPEKSCARCGGQLEFDETPESYFAFAGKYAASNVSPAAAQLLSSHGLYAATSEASEKPPRIIKLVHGSVTYFRIIGTIGSTFRARPFLVGAEGEVVIDLAEVERFDPAGLKEWKRLLKSLASQVPALTLVDVNEPFLVAAADSFGIARNIAVSSLLVPYKCTECGRVSHDSKTLLTSNLDQTFEDHVCSTCGATTRSQLAADRLIPLLKASTTPPTASMKMIAQRDEILSRALTDANVAQAGEGATPAVATDDTILGKYKIVRRLSEGGMAEVFLAKQVGIGGFEKPVALKRIQRKLLETRQQAIELFLNEAKIAGRLTHPNIVQVLDVGEVQGALYLAMEYVHGKDLRDVLKRLQQSRSRMPLGEACFVAREVAQALNHAYWSTDIDGKRLSVVHRDVSPQNIILGYDGTVKLLDFGVAMSAVTDHSAGLVVGKWLYMSPEATSNQALDHRSDLFSLGVILYLLCTGTMPFNGRTPADIVRKIRAGKYTPVEQLVQVPEGLSHLVNRLLAADPADRPERGQEVVAELTEIARQGFFESSSAKVSDFVTRLFPDEQAPDAVPAKVEIVRISASHARMSSQGSITPEPTPTVDYGTMGSQSTVSQVASRSRSNEFTTPLPTALATQPSGPTKPVWPVPARPPATRNVRTYIVIAIALVLAIAMFLLVRPR